MTARQEYAAALRAAGFSDRDADEADLVRKVESRFILLYQDEHDDMWCVARFHDHGKNGDYDGVPRFESQDRDAAAEYFFTAT